MLKLLAASTDPVQLIVNIEGPLNVKGYYFSVKGVNAAAAVVNPYDIGRFYLYGRNSAPLIALDFDYMQAINDLWQGNPDRTNGGVGAAYRYCAYFPRNYLDDNIELIETDDNMTAKINFGAAVASNTASDFIACLYADVDEGITQYQLTAIQQEMSISATGTYTRSFGTENITKVYLADRPTAGEDLTLIGSAIERITQTIGNKSGFCYTTDSIHCTNNKRMFESETKLITEIFAGEGDLNSKLADKTDLTFGIGAIAADCSPIVVLMGALLNPDKMIISDTASAQKLISIIDRKELSGHTRTAGVLKSIISIKEA